MRTYSVAERAGILWIYNGTGAPPPVERDIPKEFLWDDAVIEGRIITRAGDWRHGAENGFDESHGKYLHRDAWIGLFRHQAAFTTTVIGPDDDPWVTRWTQTSSRSGNYPGLGTWPKKNFLKSLPLTQYLMNRKKQKGKSTISIRLPGMLRVHFGSWIHFEAYVPTVVGEQLYLQFVVTRTSGLSAALFRLQYWLYLRWLLHVQFNNQDASVVKLMKTPPEQIFRPDHSIVAWRRLCEQAGADLDRDFVSPEAIDAATQLEMREHLEHA